MYLLLDFKTLQLASLQVANHGCGSLKFCEAIEHTAARRKRDSHSEKSSNKGSATPFLLADETIRAKAVPPRCIQLTTLRYRQELTVEFFVFQQLLHLFMEYIVQCRQAYEHQRMQSAMLETEGLTAALAIPEFCDLGEHFSVRELQSGGSILEFKSLIAVHNGCDRLFLQWANAVRALLPQKV